MAPILFSTATTPTEERSLEDVSKYTQKLIGSTPPGPNYIQASPYSEEAHLLNLDTLTKPHGLVAQALEIMRPLSEKYAITKYKEAFNWQEIVDRLKKLSEAEGAEYIFPATDFYIIVFRSKIPPTTDRVKLGELDEEAHKEAVASGWLLKYWFGIPDANGRNLATCIWRHLDDAKRGGGGKAHIKAMQHVRGFYLEWAVERLKLVISEDAREWDIVSWV